MLKMRDEKNHFMNSVIFYREICFDGVCLEASVGRPNWEALGFLRENTMDCLTFTKGPVKDDSDFVISLKASAIIHRGPNSVTLGNVMP